LLAVYKTDRISAYAEADKLRHRFDDPENDIAFVHPVFHLDPHLGPRSSLLNPVMINLYRLDMLDDVRAIAEDVDFVSSRKASL
jgi:hypothetical protein